MAASPMSKVIQHLRQIALLQGGQEIRQLLANQQVGIRRQWAAWSLAVIGTQEDLALLNKIATTDPLQRDGSGCVRLPGGQERPYFPVREAAKDAVRKIEGRFREKGKGK